MDWLTDPQIWAGFLTLTALEIVLGIDNLISSRSYRPGSHLPSRRPRAG